MVEIVSVWLQQHLPFTVLKQCYEMHIRLLYVVATVLTVYGIETVEHLLRYPTHLLLVATVLTVYGIETNMLFIIKLLFCYVATALTVTVLKHWIPFLPSIRPIHWLQQDLLFTICRERCEIIEEKSDNGCAALYLD